MAESHSYLAHHFDSLEQQYESASLGMWAFLATEVMFFAGLFTGYVVYRASYPEVFIEASHHLDVTLGTINTGVLLTSSLTMALAVHAAQEGRRKAIVAFLIATMILGLTFVGIKLYEYYHKYEEALIPFFGLPFHFEGHDPQRAALFFTIYFFMTGLHAFHMLIGVGVVAVIAFMAWRGRFSTIYYTPVEMTGLYWHFVDIVWVFLFPLLYLIGRH